MSAQLPVLSAVDDCWNRIGVKGDGTCPQLAEVVHCHNCPVFAEAGQQLFEHAPPPGYMQEWTQRLAQPEATGHQQSTGVIVFRIGEEWLSLNIRLLVEVAELRAVHSIPHRFDAVLTGLVNIRGELHLCVSLQDLLAMEAGGDGARELLLLRGSHGARTKLRTLAACDKANRASTAPGGGIPSKGRLMVVEYEQARWVFAVDEVLGLYHVPTAELTNVPSTVAGSEKSFSKSVFTWEGRQIGFLDGPRLFAELKDKIG